MQIEDRVMSPRELGQLVGLSAAKVRALIREGCLEHIPIGQSKKYVTLRNWEKFCRDSAVKSANRPRPIKKQKMTNQDHLSSDSQASLHG